MTTRASGVTSDVAFQVTVLTDGLEHPWAVEPLPDGDLLVTERPGRMRIVSAKGEIGAPILVDSDCHMADRLGRQMRFGVGLARRAGLTKAQVLNTRDVDAVRAFVAAKRRGRR